ncbi:unnamed protein product [Coregonus sp. 'balchen']|nr:unnamed protein product [Coregonus sp. 'balchen']
MTQSNDALQEELCVVKVELQQRERDIDALTMPPTESLLASTLTRQPPSLPQPTLPRQPPSSLAIIWKIGDYSPDTRQLNSADCSIKPSWKILRTLSYILGQMTCTQKENVCLRKKDLPWQMIHNVNQKMDSASLPNVSISNHHTLTCEHLYDHEHLDYEGVRIFAKDLSSKIIPAQQHSTPHLPAIQGERGGQSHLS